MIKNYDEAGFSYFLVQSVPHDDEPLTNEDPDARLYRHVDIVLSVLLIISMLTTLWVTL